MRSCALLHKNTQETVDRGYVFLRGELQNMTEVLSSNLPAVYAMQGGDLIQLTRRSINWRCRDGPSRYCVSSAAFLAHHCHDNALKVWDYFSKLLSCEDCVVITCRFCGRFTSTSHVDAPTQGFLGPFPLHERSIYKVALDLRPTGTSCCSFHLPFAVTVSTKEPT